MAGRKGNEEKRVAKIVLFFGTRGSGKSWYFLNTFLPAYQSAHPDKKILIVDSVDHPKYRHIPRITPEMIGRWKSPGIYRCFQGEFEPIFEQFKTLTNALVVLEDASKYIDLDLPKPLKKWFLDTKQLGTDVVCMFHGFGWCPPKLCQVSDIYAIFRTTSPLARKANIPNYDGTFEAWSKVSKSKEKWPMQTVVMY